MTTSIILVVDDQQNNLDFISDMLSEDGKEIITALSGTEALSKVKNLSNLVLALVDVHMPNMDGFEFAEKFRNMPGFSRVPLMFITSTATKKQWIFKGYEQGAVDYIIRPFDPYILRSKVDVYVDLYNAYWSLEKELEETQMMVSQLQTSSLNLTNELLSVLKGSETQKREIRSQLIDTRRMILEAIAIKQNNQKIMENINRYRSKYTEQKE